MLGRSAMITSLLALGLGSFGCGSIIEEQEAQNQIHTELERSLNITIDNVNCPPDVKVEPKATFRCDIETDEGSLQATVVVVNDDADLEIKSVAAN